MPARSSEFIALIGGLPIVVDEQTPSFALGTVLDLARKEGLSAYDARNGPRLQLREADEAARTGC
jgi:hypothetical protein